MGFLSSLFGFGGGGSSAPVTTTNVVSQKLPSEIAPYVTKILEAGQEAYDAEKEVGYQPYTGETSADLSAEQEAALTGLAGMVGTQQPFIDEAGEIFRQGADQFTGDVAQQYMSPYQQAVTDIELREAQNKFDTQIMPSFEAKAVGAGGMSGLGTRAGVQAAELQRGQSQLLADIQAKGLQKAYTAANTEYGQQKARESQMAGQIVGLGGQEVAANLTELGALKAAGEERQALSQGALDEAYFKFLEEKQFPKQNLAEFSGLVYGNPLSKLTNTSTTKQGAGGPTTGQQLLNLGIGAGNVFGLGGGFGDGFGMKTLSKSIFGVKEGGSISEGLSGLPVIRQEEGSKETTLEKQIRNKQEQQLAGMEEGPYKDLLKQQFAFNNPKRMKSVGNANIQSTSNLIQKGIQDRLKSQQGGITAVEAVRQAGIKKAQDTGVSNLAEDKANINNFNLKLGPANVGGEGIILKPGKTGVLDDIGRALNATAAGGFRTNKGNLKLDRDNKILLEEKTQKAREEARRVSQALSTESRQGKTSDVKERVAVSLASLNNTQKNKLAVLMKEQNLGTDISKLSVQNQQALIAAVKGQLGIAESKAKIAKLKAEAAKESSVSIVKPAVYNAINKTFETMQNSKFSVSVDENGNRQVRFIGGSPLDAGTSRLVNKILAEANVKVQNGEQIGAVSKYMADQFDKLSKTVDKKPSKNLPTPNADAIKALQNKPSLKRSFEQKYGKGSAAKYL